MTKGLVEGKKIRPAGLPGALIGRAVAAAMKVGIGLAMAAWVLFAAMV